MPILASVNRSLLTSDPISRLSLLEPQICPLEELNERQVSGGDVSRPNDFNEGRNWTL
jgi:hypothetical protein